MATAVATVESLPTRIPSTWWVLLANRNAQVGLILVGLLVFVARFAWLLSPHDPNTQYPDGLDSEGMPLPPSYRFPLGTDSLGRDNLSRLMFGAQVSLEVAITAVATTTFLGVLVGIVAGYSHAWVDVLLMRVTDIFLALPPLLLAIALAGVLTGKKIEWCWITITLERGVVSLVFIIAAVSWTSMARVVRAQTLSLKEREYIQAARAIGCSPFRILWRHLLPNLLPSIVVLMTLSTAGIIALEVGLSYLDIGVQAPTPSWGQMIRDGQAYLVVAPWLAVPPGIAVVVTVFGFNLLGQGLQQVLDPHQKGRA